MGGKKGKKKEDDPLLYTYKRVKHQEHSNKLIEKMLLPAPLTKQLHEFPEITSRFTWGDCRRHPHQPTCGTPRAAAAHGPQPPGSGRALPRSPRARAAGAPGAPLPAAAPGLAHAFSISRAPARTAPHCQSWLGAREARQRNLPTSN